MADLLYDLLTPHLSETKGQFPNHGSSTSTTTSQRFTRRTNEQYLTRLTTLRLNDLSTTEPQSIQQSSQSNLVSIQALSSRSHRSTTTSSDHLSTLPTRIISLSNSIQDIRSAVPNLDESAVTFANQYSKSRSTSTSNTTETEDAALQARKEAMLLARQADKLHDILDLPNLLATTIALAGTSSVGGTAGATATGGSSGANYTQALDLYAHIKRLRILYPDSQLIRSIVVQAEIAMKDMTTQLVTSLRGQNIRLAAAIRTIGLLRRVVPDLGPQLGSSTKMGVSGTSFQTNLSSMVSPVPPVSGASVQQDEGDFGALFLCARLATFLNMTEALSPLRDLADHETAKRLDESTTNVGTPLKLGARSTMRSTASSVPAGHPGYAIQGQQTERYLKRYIEIFREQSFATMSMYKSIFPEHSAALPSDSDPADSTLSSLLALPSALQSFPLHLITLFMATIRAYLPNITDPAARESLLMQVLYAANSLGRLGADFSMMIAFLDDQDGEDDLVDGDVGDGQEDNDTGVGADGSEQNITDATADRPSSGELGEAGIVVKENGEETDGMESAEEEPEWARVIRKHRVQAARLEALAAGQEQKSAMKREFSDSPR